MTSNLTLSALDSLEVAELADLPPEALADLQDAIATEAATLKRRRELFEAALDHRYGEKQLATRVDQEKDTGLIRLLDGDCTVKVDTPNKKIEWDQKLLTELEGRIRKAGDEPSVYILVKVERNVREQSYKDWPEVVRKAFEPARTVKPGKLSYVIERPSPGGK
jgi:hypothetical protein